MGYFFYVLLLSTITSVISLSVGIFSKVRSSPYSLFVLLVGFSSVGDIINVVAYAYFKLTNEYFYQLQVGYFYRILEFLILSEFFRLLNQFPVKLTRAIQLGFVSYFLFFHPSIPYFEFEAIDSATITVLNCIIFIILVVINLINYLKSLEVVDPLRDPKFYALASILIYFSGIIFIVLFRYIFWEMDLNALYFTWTLQNLFLILRNLLIIITFLKMLKSNDGV